MAFAILLILKSGLAAIRQSDWSLHNSQIYSVAPPKSPFIQVHYLQSNLSNTDTDGTEPSVRIRAVSI